MNAGCTLRTDCLSNALPIAIDAVSKGNKRTLSHRGIYCLEEVVNLSMFPFITELRAELLPNVALDSCVSKPGVFLVKKTLIRGQEI